MLLLPHHNPAPPRALTHWYANRVFDHGSAICVTSAEVLLGGGVALLCRLAIPFDGLAKVLANALSVFVAIAKVELGRGEACSAALRHHSTASG